MRARQKVSRAGVELIKSFEGLRQTAARLPDGRWTLGYGHTFSAREGATVTQEDADALLRFDLLPIVDAINNLVLTSLDQNQFDALVSFSFNIGVDNFATSTVLKRINEGRLTEAAQAMDSWRSAEFNGQTYVLAPLIRRRAAEKNLFLTPEDVAANAPSLLIRPVEDAQGEAAGGRPAEVDAPDRNGMLSARPLGEPETAPAPYMATPYGNAFEISATPQPVAAPVPAAQDRQVIDLAAFAPRPPEAAPTPVQAAPAQPILAQPYAPPAETVVEHLPHGLAPTGSVRETPVEPVAAPIPAPVAEPVPTAYDYDPAPVMSPDVQAALARAHEDQRLRDEALRDEARRQAEAMAASRVAEDARLHEEARMQELQRQDSLRAEQARLEAARLEAARLEAARLEHDRLAREEQMRNEMMRVEQARIEQARIEQARIEQARIEQARLEQARFEQARLEQEAAERQRQEAIRLELERQEQARLEQARLEAARLEQARIEQAQAEQARLEQARLEQARLEAARLEQERLAQAPAAPAVSDDEAEKARKAEAAAALMRLYSPYGSGNLGRPLTPSVLAPNKPAPAAEPRVEAQPDPQPEPVRVEPAQQSTQDVPPAPVASAPIATIVSTEEAEDDELPRTVSFAFKPGQSASSMPAPQITALNPYARQSPKTAESVFEVPRPAPVDLSVAQPATAPSTAPATESLHWREQLQRPLPQDYKVPDAAAQTAQPEQASLLRAARMGDTFEGSDDWTDASGRIALSSEEMEEEAVSWWKMIVSTLWWILISAMGLACLGFASAAYYKAIKDPSVLRNGFQQDYTTLSVIAAAVGIFFVCVSVWLIMKRLGGLKD